jgi:hypothetical protein
MNIPEKRTKEEVLAIIKECDHQTECIFSRLFDNEDVSDMPSDNILYDTEQELSLKHNAFEPTFELFDDNDKVIYNNKDGDIL